MLIKDSRFLGTGTCCCGRYRAAEPFGRSKHSFLGVGTCCSGCYCAADAGSLQQGHRSRPHHDAANHCVPPIAAALAPAVAAFAAA